MSQNRADESQIALNWVKTGMGCGVASSLIFPLLVFVPLPDVVTVTLAAAFGPALAFASVGLYYFMKYYHLTTTLQLATLSNIIAGAVINIMFLVQLSIRSGVRAFFAEADTEATRELIEWVERGLNQVHLGIDVSWDVFIGLGSFFFGLNMLNHPRFGKIFGFSGMALAALMLAFNFWTFPVPPGFERLIDLGPLIGLWYLAVTIQLFRSFSTFKTELLKS